MEILSAEQIREADRFTIEHTPISSVDLMERTAQKCFDWFVNNVPIETSIHIVCGQGNNGGDGLALARMLILEGYALRINILNTKKQLSPDCLINLERLKSIGKSHIEELNEVNDIPNFQPGSILVDAIFGTGLTGNVTGLAAEIIRKMNRSGLPIISIDLPSGINSDETSLNAGYEIIKASTTLTFQYLKLALLVPENAPYTGKIIVLDIGLLRGALDQMHLQNFQTDTNSIAAIYEPKREFSHKGNFGHSLLITGSPGKMGAGILAARGYLKSGAGLLTLFVPEEGLPIVQEAVPEAMAMSFSENSALLPDLKLFKVIGAGPGLGTGETTVKMINQLLNTTGKQLVLDADVLNIMAAHPEWLRRLPEGTVLTPHPGEFKRLAGEWSNDFEKLEKQREFAKSYQIYLVLKGKNTSIACPDGTMWFNPTGNPGMAKGGSGDILTGLITGLVSSGYSPFEACIMGTWLHGKAGDLAAEQLTQEAMNAGDIINHLPYAWKTIIEHKY